MTDILVQHDGSLATVVFNRPKRRNAISLAMWTEIARVVEGVTKDDSVRAIVFRGAGTEAFASGADISDARDLHSDRQPVPDRELQLLAQCPDIEEHGEQCRVSLLAVLQLGERGYVDAAGTVHRQGVMDRKSGGALVASGQCLLEP